MTEQQWLTSWDLSMLLNRTAESAAPCAKRKLLLFACACCRRVAHLLTDKSFRQALAAAEAHADELPNPSPWIWKARRAAEKALRLQTQQVNTARAAWERQSTTLAAKRAEGVRWWEAQAADHAAQAVAIAAWMAASHVTQPRVEVVLQAAAAAKTAVEYAAGQGKLRAAGGDEQAQQEEAETTFSESQRPLVQGWLEVAACTGRMARLDEDQVQCDLVRDLCSPFRRIEPDPVWIGPESGPVRQMAAVLYEGRRFEDMPILADALEDAGCDSSELLGHLRGPGPHARGCWALDLLLGR